jgi:hypothetical protein
LFPLFKSGGFTGNNEAVSGAFPVNHHQMSPRLNLPNRQSQAVFAL